MTTGRSASWDVRFRRLTNRRASTRAAIMSGMPTPRPTPKPRAELLPATEEMMDISAGNIASSEIRVGYSVLTAVMASCTPIRCNLQAGWIVACGLMLMAEGSSKYHLSSQ